jgi:hypothetical protein
MFWGKANQKHEPNLGVSRGVSESSLPFCKRGEESAIFLGAANIPEPTFDTGQGKPRAKEP